MAGRPQNILSLCSGIDGLGLGVHNALAELGFSPRTVCYLEREAQAAAILAARMAEGLLDEAPVWSDLESFDGEPWRGLVDGIIAGAPCQPHSHAGKRKGIEDGRWLWPDIARIIDESNARWFLLENVDGLRTSNGGEAFGKILQSLAARGFVFAWIVLSASEVGAPHRRKRLFLLATRACVEHPSSTRQSAKPGELRQEPRARAGIRTGHGNDPRHPSRDVANAFRHASKIPSSVRQNGTRRTSSAGASREDYSDSVAHADRETGRPPLGHAVSPAGAEEAGPGSQEPGRHGCRPRWPPGPEDHEAWNEVMARWPDLAPAVEYEVRGVAHGPSSGMDGNAMPRDDRLRTLGNGCVPDQVEKAFLILWRHLA